jgi:flavin reductase (DIM6/NTAB) family NADH-FMN oxidoreductase RutF
MKKFDPKETDIKSLHQLILGSVAPRPIALASTLDKDGNPNLSPFSFFNVFGVNPPTLIFSPSRRGRDNTTKDTYENVKKHAEVVINMVNYEMVEQNNLSSHEYPAGINEFEKSGFTPISSIKVKPFRVEESPVQFECKVKEVIETSQLPGAGNLVICEIIMIHVNEEVMNKAGGIDQDKIDLVGRMGGDLYCRTSGTSKFIVEKPGLINGVGVDFLPAHIRNSEVLTGNDFGKLGGLAKLPNKDEIDQALSSEDVKMLIVKFQNESNALHYAARDLIAKGEVSKALAILF